jgi:hypothetical protein
MYKIFVTLLLSLFLVGCATTDPVVITKYKAIDVPQQHRNIDPIPTGPDPEVFSSIEKDRYTVDLIKQRDMLKVYADQLLEHIRVIRLNYRSLIKHIDTSNEIIEKEQQK